MPVKARRKLTTARDRARARRMLRRRGWPVQELTLDALLELCTDEMLRELSCQYLEDVLPAWEEQFPSDDRPRAALAACRAESRCRADASATKGQDVGVSPLWAATEDARLAAIRAGTVAYNEASGDEREDVAATAFANARQAQLEMTVELMLDRRPEDLDS